MSLEFSKFANTKSLPKIHKGFITIKVKDPTYSRDASLTLELLFNDDMKEITKVSFSSLNDSSSELGIIYGKIKEQNPLQVIKGLNKNELLEFFLE